MGFCVLRLLCCLAGFLSPVVRGALLEVEPLPEHHNTLSASSLPLPAPSTANEVKNVYLRHLLSKNELFVHHSEDPADFLKVLTNEASRASVPDSSSKSDRPNTDTFVRMLSMSVLPSHVYPLYPKKSNALFFFDGSKCLAPLAYAPSHHSLITGVGGAMQTQRYHLQRAERRRWFLETLLQRKLAASIVRPGEDFMPVVKLTAAGKAFLEEDKEVWAVAERVARRSGFSAAKLFEEEPVNFGEHVEGNKRSISEILVDCPSSALLGVAPYDHDLAPTRWKPFSPHALETSTSLETLLADAGYKNPQSLILEPVPEAVLERVVGEQPFLVRDSKKGQRLGGAIVASADEELRAAPAAPSSVVGTDEERRPLHVEKNKRQFWGARRREQA